MSRELYAGSRRVVSRKWGSLAGSALLEGGAPESSSLLGQLTNHGQGRLLQHIAAVGEADARGESHDHQTRVPQNGRWGR